MHIDWWTLGLQTVNALVLISLLGHFLFRPVADVIAARQQAAQKVLAEAQAAKAAAEKERATAEAETTRLAEHRKEALKAIDTEVDNEKTKLLAAAQGEADKLRKAAESEIAAGRRAEETAAADRAGQLAVDISAKLFDRLPNDARITSFIDGLSIAN
jgi:F-type H+-transporting ATPase subunit b